MMHVHASTTQLFWNLMAGAGAYDLRRLDQPVSPLWKHCYSVTPRVRKMALIRVCRRYGVKAPPASGIGNGNIPANPWAAEIGAP